MYNFIDIKLPQSQTSTVLSYRTVLTMGRYKHQHLSLYVKNWGMTYSDIKTGSPIQVTISSPYGSQEFAGYIHSITPDLQTNKNFVEITALGATYVMKQASQNVWTNVTADQVAAQICKKHNLAYYCAPHGRVFDNLCQMGETDWEFLCKLAIQTGYTLRSEGTSVYFDTMTADFTKYQENAPYFILREANDPQGLSLFNFNPEVSDANEYDEQMKSAVAVGGVSLTSGNKIVNTNQNRPTATKTQSQTEFFDSFHTSAVIPNSQVAGYEAVAADERNRYPYRGTAEVLGDARIRPDMPVFLDGLGKDYSGYWTVLECTHIFKEKMYTTEMVVGTDSLGQVASGAKAPNPTPQRIISPTSPATSTPAASKLISNTPIVNNSAKNTGFSLAQNRKQPDATRSPNTSAPKWGNSSGNLRNQPSKTAASAATINKLRSSGVR